MSFAKLIAVGLLSQMALSTHLGFAAPPKLAQVAPELVGMRSSDLARIDGLVAEGLAAQRMPGCVIVIGRHGKIVFQRAYGNRRLQPEPSPMTIDTVFDMASITKPVATATSVMMLVERGQLRLRNRVSDYIPDFAVNGKQDITITQLLTHHGGLIPDNSLKDYLDGPELAFQRINALKTYVDPGTRFVYTDVGFIVLAEIVRRTSGEDIHQFTQKHLFGPLNMTDTGFVPAAAQRQRAAPTETRENKWMQGEVHDPRAFELGGIAGHAGLFSTAQDLAVYAQMMLQSGEYDGVRILSPLTVSTMTASRSVSGNERALGWDKQSVYSSNRSELFSPRAFGHGGFTGTVLWIDPELNLFFIFLSNRVHPNGKGNINSLAGRIATVASAAIDDALLPAIPDAKQTAVPISTGLDQLCASSCKELANQRIGLITNHTGIDQAGRHNIQRLREFPHVQLKALFSPEHGFAGRLDEANIADATEESTGLKIFSLYGKTRQPTARQLEEIDTLVFDIQDIGTRFYTYISTMGLAMQAAAEHGKRFVVLDRPNPINGITVDGPVLDQGRESFVGFHPLPVRHGMTIGELATLFKAELDLNLDLTIVKMKHWQRATYFDETGLHWINPSPNMRNLNQAILYPGVGLLETTNLSVGRGTDTPFERIGAPWINAKKLAAKLNSAKLAGIRFTPVSFQPESSVHQGKKCQGIQILIADRSQINPLDVGFEIATCLRALHPQQWESDAYDRLLADTNVMKLLQNGSSRTNIRASFQDELNEFRQRRANFLLYD
ncbi:MAG: DUF1343 domain-containing protein [Planctomycetaceae bacterium]|nr:DUF1343 domain-containing protein [Planctomycetaceae bacterium]